MRKSLMTHVRLPLFLCGLAAVTPSVQADDLTATAMGIWARGDGQARVRIAPCGGNICATNLWIKDPASSEKVGDVLVLTLKPAGGRLTGSAWDPQRKLHMSFDMEVAQNSLTTKGCVLGGVFCKNVSWSRTGG